MAHELASQSPDQNTTCAAECALPSDSSMTQAHRAVSQAASQSVSQVAECTCGGHACPSRRQAQRYRTRPTHRRTRARCSDASCVPMFPALRWPAAAPAQTPPRPPPAMSPAALPASEQACTMANSRSCLLARLNARTIGELAITGAKKFCHLQELRKQYHHPPAAAAAQLLQLLWALPSRPEFCWQSGC